MVKCADCGLCFTNPRPSPESIGQFYPHTYRPHQTCGLRRAKTREPRRYGRLGWHGEGRLLDVGCGGGEFLHRMSLAGWNVTGLDLSQEVVERIRRELGLQALAGSLPHAELTPGSFDVVTMWQSLEHFHQPLEMLEQAHKLLAPGGKLVAAVPNLDSGSFRTFGPSWFGLDLPRHLVHFTPLTLRAMLGRAGFRVESLRQIRRPSWLRALGTARAKSQPGAGPAALAGAGASGPIGGVLFPPPGPLRHHSGHGDQAAVAGKPSPPAPLPRAGEGRTVSQPPGGLLSTTTTSTPGIACTTRSRTDGPSQRRYQGRRLRPRRCA